MKKQGLLVIFSAILILSGCGTKKEDQAEKNNEAV